MKRTALGLLTLVLVPSGCFSPEDTVQSAAAAAETTGVAEDPGPMGTGEETGDVPFDDDTTGGIDEGDIEVGDSSGGDVDDPSEGGTSTGEPQEGESSSGGLEEGESSGGETCELGTSTDCTACGDACSAQGSCTPEGCLEPVTLGHAEAFDNLGGLDGLLWGFPVELDAPATLTHLAFIANGVGGDVQLSLYSDATGAPSSRLVTAPAVIGYGVGVHELAVPQQELGAGTYWIMATATNPTRLAVDLNGGAVNFAVQGIIHDFADGHPNVIADPIAFVNYRPNFYLRLLQVQ